MNGKTNNKTEIYYASSLISCSCMDHPAHNQFYDNNFLSPHLEKEM